MDSAVAPELKHDSTVLHAYTPCVNHWFQKQSFRYCISMKYFTVLKMALRTL